MKKIKLTQGKYALVDDADFEVLNKVRWSIHKSINRDVFYAKKNGEQKNYKKSTIYMHSFIMKTPIGMETDHINGNGLDNRRSNLRVVSSAQNHINQSSYKNTSSKYKGVTWHKHKHKWQAAIGFGGSVIKRNNIYLGLFTSEKEAGRAYDEKAKELYGEFARLNFA